ncbi:hypothetical protein DPMN_182742 [Dreissena polymorpha]|uniref:Uncharacterized protein n=1 Tax=Dreissena polymorpha TaxID=45954 RepID=A0A9D4DFE3_DREPO|nr:hypothetical protein DPMN_182742 [Dreissena polymorpha]
MDTPSVPGFGEGNGIAHGQNYDYAANSQPGFPAYPPPNKPEGFEGVNPQYPNAPPPPYSG